MTTPRGRQPIGIAQPPGQGGINYPLVYPSSDITQLLADACLVYKDDNQLLVPPFYINWIYGFGGDAPVGSPPAGIVFAHEIEVVDDNGAIVFSTQAATTTLYYSEVWSNRLSVVTWRQPEIHQFLHVVYHTDWSADDTPQTYPIYFQPSSAQFSSRVVHRDPPRVTSVRVGLNTYKDTQLQLTDGYNAQWTAGETESVAGRRKTQLTLETAPGLGIGQFEEGCDDYVPDLKQINEVPPSEGGRFFLDTGGCYRIQQPVTQEITPVPDRIVQIQNNALSISNDCGPCCECDDFIAVWEAIRRLRNRYADLVQAAQTARDIYHQNRRRFNENQECRLNDRLRVSLQPSCPGQLGVSVGYCNNSATCLYGLVIQMSFQYADSNNCKGPDGISQLRADTEASFSSVICDSSFRGGFVDPVRFGNKKYVRNEFYQLGGSWPHYWAYFPQVDPSGMAYTLFRLQFLDAQTASLVEVVADAFAIGSNPPVGSNPQTPVQGYTPGVGCTSDVCRELQLVSCPSKDSANLIPYCCDDSVSLDEGGTVIITF